MERSLRSFRAAYRETLLRFLWRAWTTLGVSGRVDTAFVAVLDPDALLVFTCTVGRQDARLFDEVLDWLLVNGRFINVQRVRNLMRKEGFQAGPVLGAVAHWLSAQGHAAKWKRLAEFYAPVVPPEPLFFLEDGNPLPVIGQNDCAFYERGFSRNPVISRGLSQPFPPNPIPCLWLKLRALFGVNARAEILLYLMTHAFGHPRMIARHTYFSQKTVYDALDEMTRSGTIMSARSGRERVFRLQADGLTRALSDAPLERPWVHWPDLLAGAEMIWLRVDALCRAQLDPLTESSEIALLLQDFFTRTTPNLWSLAQLPISRAEGLETLWLYLELFDRVAR